MSFKCTFCRQPAEMSPALVESVAYDSEKDLLVEKVISCSNLFLCWGCNNELRSSSIAQQHDFFAAGLSDARVETIFQGAISDFFYRPLIQILKYCIVIRDGETIQKMQMKDSRVPFLLKCIFNQFIQLDYFADNEFILSQISDIKIKAECLVCLAVNNIDRGDFTFAGRTFLRAFDHARLVRNEVEKNNLLIRIGYGIAKFTVSLISSLVREEIAENISHVHEIISCLSTPMHASVEAEKNNILIMCQVAKLLGEQRFESARLVAVLMTHRDLNAVMSIITIMEEAVSQ